MNKSKNKRIYVIEFINYSGPSEMSTWTDSDGRTKEQCLEKGKCFIEDLVYTKIVESRTNESVVVSY